MSIDQPTDVRKGEQLDEVTLLTYLKQHIAPLDSQRDGGSLTIRQFPGGFSNLTYFLSDGEREYVLRRPPVGANVKGGHDMGREFRVLEALAPTAVKVPAPLHYCEDESIIGAPFYVMERVQGIILRSQPPKGLTLSPELMQGLSEATVDQMVALHQIDLQASGLAALSKGEGYVQRQVGGWTSRYQKSKTDEIEDMETVAQWLQANMPADRPEAFIHNDYKYDNLVLNPEDLSEIIAILDWEMATVGDPLMDLGTTLAYWAEGTDPDALKPFNLTWMPGNLDRQGVIDRYFAQSGQEAVDMVFYYAFGSFKVAVIAQQIYARFKAGLTKDPRFGMLIHVVRACARNAALAISKQRISGLHQD